MYLPQYGHVRKLYQPCNAREMLSWAFLHNNYLWPAYIPHAIVYEFWSKVEIPFTGHCEMRSLFHRGAFAVKTQDRITL